MIRSCRYLHKTWLPRLTRYRAVPRNMFYSLILGAEDIHLGSHNRIRGADNLRIGRGFKALDYLWLDAVERDRAGNCYKPVLVIGDNVVVGYSVHLSATHSVRIGSHVLVGSRVIVTDHNHGIYNGDVQSTPMEQPAMRVLTPDAETIVEDNVWIGDGVVVLPGAHIGTGSIVGANSVVTGVVPKHCIVAGNPARLVKVYDSDTESWVPAEKAVSVVHAPRAAKAPIDKR
jgi:acetyltransferase-like isoleucine patch superfamily enzyme